MNDLRRKVLAAYLRQEGSERALARRFAVSLRFVRDLLKRYRGTGDAIPNPHAGGRAHKIAEANALILRKRIRQRTVFVNLTGQTVSAVTVGLNLSRLGLTRKKKTVRAREAPSEAIQEARDAFHSPCQIGLPTARLHVTEPHYPATGRRVRPLMLLETMLQPYCLQQWHTLSDPKMKSTS
ncbi:transposase [Plasticicumulans lactativorans]|uniref:Transposase n=1 Tax=Plasticicumulans lactativorans TaxID=1133106 RepID=A0A4R2LEG4_9GAMM|nr:helix-turn-helix domain-containing protein [Plasticicumulans lactativorans]TCO83056.1 transposase [Plasticicumulans lactativorans]